MTKLISKQNLKSAFFFLTLNILAITQVFAQANNFAWAKKAGSQFDDNGYAIITDGSGNVYTSGYFEGTTDFDPGAGTANITSQGLGDIFILKLDGSGNFMWAKSMGGTGFDYGYSIAIDQAGNIITTGSFEGTVDFNPATASFNLTSSGGHDIFIQKLDASGNFLWAAKIGGTGEDEGLSITTDISLNVIATGYFSNAVDFDPGNGVNNITSNGLYDNFIIKLDATGNYKWATAIGGTNYDYSKSVAVDINGNVFSTGTFGSTVDLDPGVNSFLLTSNGGSVYGDIYIQKLDSSGNFMWAKQMGWFGDDIGSSIKTDVNGNVYTTGWFQVTVDFDPGAATYSLTSDGGGYTDDVFVQKLDGNGNFIWAVNMGGQSDDRGFSLTLDNSGNVCTTGYHSGTGDFDPGTGTLNLTGDGSFLQKLTNASNFVWAKQMSLSQGNAICADLSGNIFSTGQFDHTVDFDPGSGSFNLSSNAGSVDIYIQKLSNASAGITENIFENAGIISPNPTRGEFTIDLDKFYSSLSIEIKNITGQLVYKTEFSQTNQPIINLNQPAGVYFVAVSSDNYFRNFKLIKE